VYVLISNSKKSAKAKNRICDFTADFVEHQTFDPTNFIAVGPSNCRSFNPVARNQTVLLVGRHYHLPSPILEKVCQSMLYNTLHGYLVLLSTA
jgi:hypothetical protein